MKCKICNAEAKLEFVHKVIQKYDVEYYYCPNCAFLFTEEPYWLEESYKIPINLADTGIMSRNLYFSKAISSIIYLFFEKNDKFLDYAGGYGIFTRLMRDIGFDFYWDDKYTENILARGFEYDPEKQKGFELLTTFEVFEHLVNPVEEIRRMLELSTNIIFSTELLPSKVPSPESWWYYGFTHGQHISFYSGRTLKYIAEKYSLNFYSFGEIHLFTKKKINPILFQFIIRLSKYGLGFLVSQLMKSKTWDDHLYLEGNPKNG